MDEHLLLWINQGWAHPWLDWLFGWLSSRTAFALPLTLLLLLWCYRIWGKQGLIIWGLLVLTVAGGDFIGNLLKQLAQQARPCFAIAELIRIPGYPAGHHCGPALTGWPSNHSLNFFTVAIFLSRLSRQQLLAGILFGIAVLVGLSRIYLAKHYPSQVAAGAILGLLWGYAAASLVAARLHLKRVPEKTGTVRGKTHTDE